MYKIFFVLFLFIIYACGTTAIVKTDKQNQTERFSTSNTSGNNSEVLKADTIVYYLDYDNFTDKLLTRVNEEYIKKNNVLNYVKLIKDNNKPGYKRGWYISGILKMVEFFSDKNIILAQHLFYKNEVVKRFYHYIGDKIYKINIFNAGNLNGIIEYFYNDKNILYKLRRYDGKYTPVSETIITYDRNNRIINEMEYKINSNDKSITLTREYTVNYRAGIRISDIEYRIDKQGKYKYMERFFDSNGEIKSGIIYSSHIREAKLFSSEYENNILISSTSYYGNGKVKNQINYQENEEQSRINFSQTGEITIEKRFNGYSRIARIYGN